MLSFSQQQTIYGDLSGNASAANLTRGAYLSNFEHRYLLQKYFQNETSYSVPTIGGNTYYLTAAPAIAATSATLAVAWASPTATINVTFSDGETRNVLFTHSSTAITWQIPLTGTTYNLTANVSSGATTATLQTAWSAATQTSTTAFTDGETKSITFTQGSAAISWVGGLTSTVGSTIQTSVMTTAISIGGAQFYRMPPNYSKLKDITITVGNLQWTLTEIRTRQEWDNLNVFPYFADIPANFFIYPGGDRAGQIGIWPIPSSTGNTITFNYKFRVPDLSIADYSTGTVSVANGGTVVTGAGTSWTISTNLGTESRWIQFSPTSTSTTAGDNLWYQVYSVDSATQITLYGPYQGTTIAASPTYTLGQMSLLPEDFQDLLYIKPLMDYFTSAVGNDPEKAKEYKESYDMKVALLSEYSGSNTVQVNLSRRRRTGNPNSYPYKLTG